MLAFTPDMSRPEADQLVLGPQQRRRNSPKTAPNEFLLRSPRTSVAGRCLLSRPLLFAQEPFRFPTANHFLFEPGKELKFFAPTAPDKPWTSGSFGCVRDNGQRMHEGLDIRCLQTDKRGEPTDPVMATADGTVVYFSTRPSLSNYGNYIVIRHVVEGIEIYSLYAHLSAVRPGLKIGQAVKAGEVIATMGRTSNTAERIAKWRAHVHFRIERAGQRLVCGLVQKRHSRANATTTANGTARISMASTRAKFCWPNTPKAPNSAC